MADGETPVTIFYNGECPICRREIDVYKDIAMRHDLPLVWRDITTDTAALSEIGLTRDTAARRLYVVDETGRLLAGLEAFVRLWRELPGFGWLARVSSVPVIRPLASLVYERVLAPALYAMHKRRERRKQTGA